LAYLSKPVAVTLPAALVLLDGYPLRRWQRGHALRVALEKLPYAIPAAVIAAAAPLARTHAGLLEGDHYGPLLRIGQAAYGLVFYLWKTIAPFDLTFYYPLPLDADPLQTRFVASGIAVLALAGVVWRLRRRWPGLLVGALAYAALLSPVLGLIPQGGQLAADRYTYFASVPVALVFGGGLYACWPWVEHASRPWQRWAAGGTVLALIVSLCALTWRQVETWKDAGTLWAHAVAAAPGAFQPRNNLGLYFLGRDDYSAALREFDDTLRLNPKSAKAHFNRGHALARLGRRDEAILAYERGLALRPNDPTAWAHVGELLAGQGRYSEAESSYRRAVALTPHPDLFNSLGIVLAEQGRIDEAIGAFREALARDPRHEDARANLETALKERSH
jgi:tetratricopeptide (TPR) repeat protein